MDRLPDRIPHTIKNEDLVAALMSAAAKTNKPLLQNESWCCKAMRTSSGRMRLADGTSLKIHFCPRCGKEL